MKINKSFITSAFFKYCLIDKPKLRENTSSFRIRQINQIILQHISISNINKPAFNNSFFKPCLLCMESYAIRFKPNLLVLDSASELGLSSIGAFAVREFSTVSTVRFTGNEQESKTSYLNNSEMRNFYE